MTCSKPPMTSPDSQSEIGRINRRIALAYAAKVKLYQAYEQDPQTNAVTGINRTLLQEVVDLINGIQGYDLLADFQQLDLLEYENGPESVFAIQFSKDDGSSGVGRINWSMLLNSMTGPGCPGRATASSSLAGPHQRLSDRCQRSAGV